MYTFLDVSIFRKRKELHLSSKFRSSDPVYLEPQRDCASSASLWHLVSPITDWQTKQPAAIRIASSLANSHFCLAAASCNKRLASGRGGGMASSGVTMVLASNTAATRSDPTRCLKTPTGKPLDSKGKGGACRKTNSPRSHFCVLDDSYGNCQKIWHLLAFKSISVHIVKMIHLRQTWVIPSLLESTWWRNLFKKTHDKWQSVQWVQLANTSLKQSQWQDPAVGSVF